VRVFLGQAHKLKRELVAKLVRLRDELKSLRVREDAPGRGSALIFLENRLVLFRRRARLICALIPVRRGGQAEHEGHDGAASAFHGRPSFLEASSAGPAIRQPPRRASFSWKPGRSSTAGLTTPRGTLPRERSSIP